MLRSATASLGLLVLLTAAACGGSTPAQPAGSTRVVMSEFKFEPSSISVPAGKATFFLVNSGSAPHNMVILGTDGKRVAASELVQGGASSTFSVADLRAGSYRFICDQPGHEQAGMKGTLTVT